MSDLTVGPRGWRGSRVPALSHVSLDIEPGFFALLGPSGSGKSMLLRVLATLQAPRHGDALVAGHSVRRDRLGVRRAIGYVPQVTRFYPDVRVRHLLNYLAGLSGLHGRALDARCTQTLAAVHLTEHAGLRIKQLSGGLRQRLAIAQALVHEPSVLLADEPGSGLDPEEREHLRTLLAELALDRTVVVATHLTQDIAPVCTQLAVLQGGTVRFAGSPSDLAEQARGKVWQQLLPDAEVMAVLSGPRPVARVTRTAGGMLVRLIGSGGAGLQPVVEPPTVEEGYLALIGKEAQSCA